MKVLISWIGFTDVRASKGELGAGELGPIAQAVLKMTFDSIHLIGDFPKDVTDHYISWLKEQTAVEIKFNKATLSGPTNFGDIYHEVVRIVDPLSQNPNNNLTFHLSPGTPAMSAVWLILGKTRYPAELIESSREAGVKVSSIPFDISAEFIPDLFRKSDESLQRLTAGLPPEAPEFEHIIYKSAVMQKVVARAQRVAPRSIPVLIEGESGTGKELFARAIHQISPRKDAPFISVNCGAIPAELVESMLFGHKKGAFTGAFKDHKGYFESANGGTLFLDEIGELPLESQVRLLRVIQENEVVPVGEVEPRKVNIRIITATNRSLMSEVQNKHFREDLYYRIAVALIKLPPLRDRKGDLGLLIDKLLEQVNQESKLEPGFKHKKISVKARNIMLKHSWPGNVRELLNTLRSAAVWSEGDKITEQDMKDALLVMPDGISGKDQILNQDVLQGIELKEIISDVARHYLTRALAEVHDNKTKAAKLLGLGNYQTLSNWIEKYGLEKQK